MQLGSYNAVAKKHGISKDTVRRVVAGNADFAQKAQQKKEENEAEMLVHMDRQVKTAEGILDKFLVALGDEEKLKKASIQSIATAMGILIDKFVCTPQEVAKLRAQTASLRGEDTHSQQQEDDPITRSLKEQFREE